VQANRNGCLVHHPSESLPLGAHQGHGHNALLRRPIKPGSFPHKGSGPWAFKKGEGAQLTIRERFEIMNKYIAILSLAAGIGVFAAAVNIATPRPVLRTTEDSVLRAEYDAPSVHFAGSLEPSKGAAHSPTAHTSRTVNRASVPTESDGPTFGQFSTPTAMAYSTVGYHSHTPNPRQVVGEITVNGYVSK
jgi:hypothetical protein